MQAFSEMQTDAEFDLKPKPYPSGAFSCFCAHIWNFDAKYLVY